MRSVELESDAVKTPYSHKHMRTLITHSEQTWTEKEERDTERDREVEGERERERESDRQIDRKRVRDKERKKERKKKRKYA